MSEGPSPDDQVRAQQAAGDAPAGAPACPSCGAPLQPQQDWCLRCGAGRARARSGPGWRSAAAALGGAGVLALGAAAAAYAAFNGTPATRRPAGAVAQTPPATTPPATPPATTPPATTPPASTPPTSTATSTATATSGTASGSTPPLPATHNPPRIPATSSILPTATESTRATGSANAGSATGSGKPNRGSGNAKHGNGHPSGAEACASSSAERERAEEEAEATSDTTSTTTTSTTPTPSASSTSSTQTTSTTTSTGHATSTQAACSGRGSPTTAPILLRATDVSTYDPNRYPQAGYVHPQLAVDGDSSTAWTAAPAPNLAPKVQAGLLVNLHHRRQIAEVALISRTLGMSVRIYGTTSRTAPKSIGSKHWLELSRVHLVEQRSSTIKLEHATKIRWLLVWVLRAPEVEPTVVGEAVEDAAAINELALYEPR
ncbi:MAG: hypothetical protein ACYCUM_05725 [Solirubrobacteraceae bacterium]